MSTLHLSDTLLDGYVALFDQLGPKDQAILLNKLTESTKNAPQPPAHTPTVVYLSEPANAPSLDELAGSWDFDETPELTAHRTRGVRTQNRNYHFEKEADPNGIASAREVFGAWGGEANREDVDRMLRTIAENRTLEREVEL